MDINHHEAQEALAAWVPRLDHLIDMGERDTHNYDWREMVGKFTTLLLAQAGRQASLPGVDIPSAFLDECRELVPNFGTRLVLNGYSFCEPGSHWSSATTAVDDPLILRMPGTDHSLPFSGLNYRDQCAAGLFLWGGAVANLATYEQSGGADQLRVVDWWLTKAGMAWEHLKGPDWQAVEMKAVAVCKERWRSMKVSTNMHDAMFGYACLEETMAVELAMVALPIVSLPVDKLRGVTREVTVLTPYLVAHARAAHAAGFTGAAIPTVRTDGSVSSRSAAWIGNIIDQEMADLSDAGISVGGLYPELGFCETIVSHLNDDGLYHLAGKAGMLD